MSHLEAKLLDKENDLKHFETLCRECHARFELDLSNYKSKIEKLKNNILETENKTSELMHKEEDIRN